jgi:penicillin-binding protein 1C
MSRIWFRRMVFIGPLAMVFISLFFPIRTENLKKPCSQTIYERNGELLRVFLSEDEKWRIPVELEEVSGELKDFIVMVEDKTFAYHFGINPWALIRAFYLNFKNRKIVSGGSTITMQVARMMEHRDRTIFSKIIEIFKAIKLEILYSKDEILEFYLNIAPYGGNIEGIGAACYYYFQRCPSSISISQAALLTAIPNSPNELRPDINLDMAKEARDRILIKLKEKGAISAEEYREAINEKIMLAESGMPFKAPHFTDYLHDRYKENRIYSTLDLQTQIIADNILKKHLSKLRRIGITNGAIIIIDNNTKELLSMVGSYDFRDSLHSGQVNGALSSRSPGSTLKPILYALGIERGLVTPHSLLSDVPTEYSGYSPENYDGKYHGLVSVDEALRFSMNVPAVNLLAHIKPENFISTLKRGGISTIDGKERNYGLSLILGGCEVKLLELTNFYSIFANGGIFKPLFMKMGESHDEKKRVFSEGISYIISELLSEVRRPDLPEFWKFTSDMPKVAWKTGTSYGHRDAWSIGYTRNFTVGVWVGNFNGASVPELVGSRVAGPILFEVLLSIVDEGDRIWFEKPKCVKRREVCALSGMVPNNNCPNRTEDYYIPGISPEEQCDIHKLFYIDTNTGYRITRKDLEGKEYKEKVYEVFPPEVATWMKKNGYPIEEVPEVHPESQEISSGDGPDIKSPQNNMEYIIMRSVPADYQKLPLEASVDNSVREIYWFIDGRIVYSGKPENIVFIQPEQGEHTIVCQDDQGRLSSVKILVR